MSGPSSSRRRHGQFAPPYKQARSRLYNQQQKCQQCRPGGGGIDRRYQAKIFGCQVDKAEIQHCSPTNTVDAPIILASCPRLEKPPSMTNK